MDAIDLLYRVTFWMLPVMLAVMLGLVIVAMVIEFFKPVKWTWKRELICPYSRQEAGAELMRSKRPGLPAKICVIRCTELGQGPVLCDQDCLRLKSNQPLARPADLKEDIYDFRFN